MRSRRALGGIAAVVVIAAIATAAWRLAPWWRERAMRTAPRPLNVVIVTLDTTRADRLGAYGYPRAETPNLDALAGRGTLFREAYAHVPLTLPSHASLMTGLLPTRHGVRDNGTFVVPRELAMVTERFRDAGYHTGAFVSAFVLDRRFGLARGFDRYDDDVPGQDAAKAGDPSERSVRAEATVDRAIHWLGAGDARPRFMWVHLYDPHAPYEAPEPFAGRHPDAPYDGEIAYTDAQIGRLLQALEGSGSRAPWLVVVVGDHGEGLGDHEEMTHGYFVYGNTQRVPLIISLPGHVPAARTVDGVVRVVDIAPTVLEIAGLPPLPGADGRSLVRLMAGSASGDAGPAYLESFHPRIWWGAQELLALRTGRWLFVEAPRPELYDVAADPAERVNVATTHPRELETLTTLLKDYARAGAPASPRATLDPAAEARLRSLGYLGSGQIDPGPGAALPDAKDNGPLLAAVSQGQELAAAGRHEDALAQFRAALQKNPRSVAARLRVAEALLALARHDEAFAAFGDVAATGLANESAYVGMLKARAGQGRTADALAVADGGLQSMPDSALLHVQRGELLLRLDRVSDAESAFRRALTLASGDEPALWGLAVALAKLARQRESLKVMLALAETSPLSMQARAAAEAIERWGDERLDAGAAADAQRAYEAALATGRRSVQLYLNLGLATFRASGNDAQRTLAVLERALGHFPDSADLLYRRGRMLEQLGKAPEARQSFERALSRAPEHGEARAALERYSSRGSNVR
jgi:choline-sulfatase